jgi:hypothetical protein
MKMKVTEKNFESFVKKHVKDGRLYGIELPRNNDDFKKLTRDLYGVTLTVSCFAYPLGSFSNHTYSCSYEVAEVEDKYSSGKIYKLWEEKYGQYDGLSVLLDSCFGRRFCGGVARAHYGQTECDKKTWERVKNWDGCNEMKHIKSAMAQHDEMVAIYGFDPLIK